MATRKFLLAGVVVLGAVGAACGSGESDDVELDRYLCEPADLDGEFIELIRGEFTPGDLADLSDDAGARERQFRDAGMQRGRFVFLKQVLPKPPFEPPMSVACQVIEFETARGAERYAAGLDADHATLKLTGIAWLPGDDEIVEDLAPNVHRVTLDEAGREVSVLVGYTANDRFFSSVYLGSEGKPPEVATLRVLESRIAERLR